METKKEYTAPELTVVSFKTERGYAASGFDAFKLISSLVGLNENNMEAWTIYEEDDAFDQTTIGWD